MLLSWCGWHMQVLCNFYKSVNISMLWSISRHGGMKRMPRQRIRKWCHGNIPVPIAHGDTGAKGKVTRAWRTIEGGVIPDTGFPQDGGMTKEEHRNKQSQTVQTRGSSHTPHSIRSRKVVSGLYLRSVRYRSGSSSMRCRGSRRSRNGRSGTRRW